MACLVGVLQKPFSDAQLMEDEVHISISAMKLIKCTAQKSFNTYYPQEYKSQKLCGWQLLQLSPSTWMVTRG